MVLATRRQYTVIKNNLHTKEVVVGRLKAEGNISCATILKMSIARKLTSAETHQSMHRRTACLPTKQVICDHYQLKVYETEGNKG